METEIYNEFKNTKIWEVLDQGIQNLIDNQDIEEKTNREYLIGYLLKLLKEKECIKSDSLKKY